MDLSLATSDWANLGLLLLRLLIGLVLAVHGLAKLRTFAGTAGWFESEGLRPGRLHATAAILAELGGGLLLAAGFLTPLAAAAIVGTMVTAYWVAHRSSGFMINKGGWEYVFVLGSAAVIIALMGPGQWSLDYAVGFDNWSGLTWGIFADVLGVVAGIVTLVVFYRPPPAAD